jgi:acetyl-CoA carboxylase carboxyltransferase component
MGAEGASDIIFRKEIKAAEDKVTEKERLLETYKDKFYNPYMAASRGLVDDIIEPGETRNYIISSLFH